MVFFDSYRRSLSGSDCWARSVPWKNPIRVLVANHPRLMREIVLTTFADQPDIEIVGKSKMSPI